MVFKIFGTSLSNFINKSWTDTVKDFKVSGISSLIKDYAKALQNGQTRTKAFRSTLSEAFLAAKKQAVEIAKLNTQYKSGAIDSKTYSAQLKTLGVETEKVSLKTKSATAGFQMLKGVLTIIAFAAIIQGISYLVKGLSDLANNVSKTKEKVKSLTDEFNSAISTANNNAKKTEELIDDYAKLSKGVNNLGENVSLTNEEYDKYNSLVNEIADMFPNLVQGYTDEGNAILNLKGNVEKLRDAYKEAQTEAYNLLITSGKDGDGNDIIKQWQDTQDTNFWAKLFDLGADDVGGGISISDAISQLRAIQNMTAEEYRQIMATVSAGGSEAIAQLSDIEKEIGYGDYLGKELGLTWNVSDEDFAEAKKQAKALVQTYNAEIESDLSSVKSLANAYLMTSDDYDKLDKQSKTSASLIINSLDENIASEFKDQTDVAKYVNKIVESFNNANVKDTINSLFTLDTSTMSVNDINSQVDKYINIIASAIDEDSNKLKIRLGFDDVDNILERAKRKFQTGIATSGIPSSVYNEQIASFLSNLTLDDLNIAMQIPDLFAEGLSKASEKIAEFKADPNNVITLTFDYSEYSEQVDDIVKNVDKVQTALDKLNGGKTIDSKDITELANAFPDYSTKILSATNDTEKLKSVLREIKSDAPRSLINTLTNLKDLSKEDQEAVNGLINVLNSLNSVSSTYSDVLADLETKQSLLSTAYKEMHDDGEVSIGTYQKLIDSGMEYSEAIKIANGKITVNVEKLKELTEEKSKAEIETLKLARAELIYNSALAVAGGINVSEEIANIDREIEAKQKAIDFLENYDYTTTAKKDKEEKPQSVTDFEAEYARRQHEINMGRMKEDEDYYSWLDEAAHTAYDGLKDYEDDLWKYEEEVYKGRKQLADDFYDEQQKDFEDRVSNLENDIEVTTKYSTDAEGNKLDLEEKIDYISSAYQEIINEINSRIGEILDAGIEGHEDDVAELEKQIVEYQEKLDGVFDDVFKTAAEEEQKYIENLKNDYSDLYDERINKIKKQKEEAEKAAQAEIDAVQEKIDALKKANDQEQEALDIAKARKELEKASQSTRQVYGADGTISFQVDKEKIQEAQENLDKLLLEQQTNILEEQKELLEQAKDKESEAYDNIIENLETEKDNEEKRFDILLEALDKYLNPEQDKSNSEVWKMLSHIEGATYKNGVWSDKDGNVIDLEELINSIEDNKQNADKENVGISTNSSNDNGKTDVVISGNLERLTIGDETSNVENNNKIETGFDKFLSVLENNLGLKNSTLTLDKITKAFNNSREMGYSPYMALSERMGNAGKGYVNNVNNNNNASNINIGDIVIQNPVGNSDDLAKELALNLPNAFQKQIYTNLKR